MSITLRDHARDVTRRPVLVAPRDSLRRVAHTLWEQSVGVAVVGTVEQPRGGVNRTSGHRPPSPMGKVRHDVPARGHTGAHARRRRSVTCPQRACVAVAGDLDTAAVTGIVETRLADRRGVRDRPAHGPLRAVLSGGAHGTRSRAR